MSGIDAVEVDAGSGVLGPDVVELRVGDLVIVADPETDRDRRADAEAVGDVEAGGPARDRVDGAEAARGDDPAADGGVSPAVGWRGWVGAAVGFAAGVVAVSVVSGGWLFLGVACVVVGVALFGFASWSPRWVPSVAGVVGAGVGAGVVVAGAVRLVVSGFDSVDGGWVVGVLAVAFGVLLVLLAARVFGLVDPSGWWGRIVGVLTGDRAGLVAGVVGGCCVVVVAVVLMGGEAWLGVRGCLLVLGVLVLVGAVAVWREADRVAGAALMLGGVLLGVVGVLVWPESTLAGVGVGNV